MLRKMFRDKKGQGLVEYGLIIAGVALVAAAAISMFGHKTTDLIGAVAAVLPGAHSNDNAPIISGELIEIANVGGGAGPIGLDLDAIVNNSGSRRLGNNIVGGGNAFNGFNSLLVHPPGAPATPDP